MLGGPIRLWPLLLALPFGVLFVYFDAKGEARVAAAELAGSAAFAVLPTTFALLAGWPVGASLGLAVLSVTRSMPTVLTVRTYLRRRKGQSAPALPAMLAGTGGVFAVITLAAMRQIPWLSTLGSAVLCLCTAALLSKNAPHWSARRTGILEAILGSAYVTLIAIAYHIQ